MTMALWRHLLIAPVPILLLLLSHGLCSPASAASPTAPAAPAGGLAVRACRRAARQDPNVKAAFCAAALKETWLASGSSSGAGGSKRRSRRPFPRTPSGVAQLSVRAALLNASATTAAIRRMLLPGGKAAPGGRDRQARACVLDCLQLYSDAAQGLRDSVRAVREGRLDDASAWISAAMDAPDTCRDGFEELAGRRRGRGRRGNKGRTWNPLRKNDKDLFQLSAMALTFISFLR